jgi:hypothetical protein
MEHLKSKTTTNMKCIIASQAETAMQKLCVCKHHEHDVKQPGSLHHLNTGAENIYKPHTDQMQSANRRPTQAHDSMEAGLTQA